MTGDSGNSYDTAVPRLPAILLLGLFSFSLIEPAVFADGEWNLPACCRRAGKHHCAMPRTEGLSIQGTCSSYPQRGAAPASGKTAAAWRTPNGSAPVAAHRAGRVQTEIHFHESHSRNHNKRGPPVT